MLSIAPFAKCVAQIYKCAYTQMHKCTNAQMHKYTNSQIHKYKNSQIHKYTNTNAFARTWVGVGNQLQVHCTVHCEQDIEGQGAVNGSDWLLLHCTNISISQLNSQWLPQVTSTKRLDRSQSLFYFV